MALLLHALSTLNGYVVSIGQHSQTLSISDAESLRFAAKDLAGPTLLSISPIVQESRWATVGWCYHAGTCPAPGETV